MLLISFHLFIHTGVRADYGPCHLACTSSSNDRKICSAYWQVGYDWFVELIPFLRMACCDYCYGFQDEYKWWRDNSCGKPLRYLH